MKLKEKFIAQNMGDEILLVCADDSMSHGFIRGNSSAALIIEALQEEITEEQIVERLLEEYDAPRDVIEQDVRAVIEKLSRIDAIDSSDAQATSSFEEQLRENGRIMYHISGDSMMPLLRQGKDVAVIVAVPEGERLKKYDVPLYKRDSGQYVLHRIIKVREKDYVICGDNRYYAETGITDRHIIGVLEGVVRDGSVIPPSDPEYIAKLEKHHKHRAVKRIAYGIKRRLGGKGKA